MLAFKYSRQSTKKVIFEQQNVINHNCCQQVVFRYTAAEYVLIDISLIAKHHLLYYFGPTFGLDETRTTGTSPSSERWVLLTFLHMKLLLVTLLIFCSYAHGQRHTDIKEAVAKGDSLEVLYATDDLFKSITDTLPIYTFDENSGWRDIKLVQYFYDNSNVLKKISFRNGREGYYYFYFEGASLRKVRVVKNAGLINLQYFFTNRDNQHTASEIDGVITRHSEQKDSYELLKMGKSFFDKFKTLL
jgi:hypothetical protein